MKRVQSSDQPKHSAEYDITKSTELSEAELDQISGGLDVSFTLLMVDESSEFLSQEYTSDNRSQLVQRGSRRRSIFGFQFMGSFDSMDHFMSFFSDFMGLFGRRR